MPYECQYCKHRAYCHGDGPHGWCPNFAALHLLFTKLCAYSQSIKMGQRETVGPLLLRGGAGGGQEKE